MFAYLWIWIKWCPIPDYGNGSKELIQFKQSHGVKAGVGVCQNLGWKLSYLGLRHIKMLTGGILNGLWVNLSSLVYEEGGLHWKSVCSGFHGVWVGLGWFLASPAQLLPAWECSWLDGSDQCKTRDLLGILSSNIKKLELFLQYLALSLCLVVADREMWKPLFRLIAFMICSIWVNLFSVPCTISFCHSK